jgi:hypothetical protein
VPEGKAEKPAKAEKVEYVEEEIPEKPITTIEEAHNYLGSIFASVEKNVSYLDEELVIENANQLQKLNNKFGAITTDNHGYISGTKIKAVAETRNNLADNVCDLTLSNKYYSKKSTLIATEKKMQEAFYSMPVTNELLNVASITHEYGHILENEIIRKRISEETFKKYEYEKQYGRRSKAYSYLLADEKKHAKEIYLEILAIAKEDNPEFKLSEQLSKYGHTNHFEAFAEIFMNSQCGVPNMFGKAMNKWLKKEGY